MARKGSPTILQEELYPLPGERSREEIDDARMLDLDVEQESPFLRGQKRVSARRGSLPKKTASVLMWLAFSLGVLFLGGVVGSMLYHYGEHSWRFRMKSSDDIEIAGLAQRHSCPGYGSDGRRHRPQYFLCPAGRAQNATRADSLGGICQRHALRAQPAAG